MSGSPIGLSNRRHATHINHRNASSSQSLPLIQVEQPISSGARLTYRELLEAGIILPSARLPYRDLAVIHPGVRLFDPPFDDHQDDPNIGIRDMPPHPRPYLHKRDRSSQAYALTGQRISLAHHHPNWGYIFFGIIYRKGNNGLFNPPISPNEVQHVAIKQLRKETIQMGLDMNSPNDPYKEVYYLQTLGDNIHVLPCIEALEDDVFLYIITRRGKCTLMELIPWHRKPPLEVERVEFLFLQIINILQYLERNNVCHRDLKPDNILVVDDKDHLVVFDFGLSVGIPMVDHPLPQTTAARRRRAIINGGEGVFGTKYYICPELIMNEPYDGVHTDLWAAIVMLFNLATGEILYESPLKQDVSFLYFILAKGLSSTPMNDNTEQVLRRVFEQHRQQPSPIINTFLSRVQAVQSLSGEILEVLENVLNIDLRRRWSLARVAESSFCERRSS